MNFILLARGDSLEEARVLAVSADQRLVDGFLAELAGDHEEPEERSERQTLHVVPDAGE